MSQYLLDVNVLLALSLPTHLHHGSATTWFESGRNWATTPITEIAYIRLMTNPRVVGYEIPVDQVLAGLITMRGLAGHAFLPDETSLTQPAITLSRLVGSKQVTDFHLVNLAAHHSATLATFDGSLVQALHPDDRYLVHVLTD